MRLVYGDLDLTDFPYAIQFGMDTGAPQNLVEAFAFLLQDGEVELSSRASNRSVVFTVLVEGADLADCAASEAALIGESEKALNTIDVDPEDFGPVSVYETFRGQVTLARDDNGEMARLRSYTVTVRALPFVRSADEVVTAALPASGSTTTTVDNCAATTGWTGAVNGVSTAVTSDAGPPTTVSVTATSPVGATTLSLSKTFALDTSSLRYLVVDWVPALEPTVSVASGRKLSASADGVTLARISDIGSGSSRQTWFLVEAASVAVLKLTLGPISGSPATVTLTVDKVSISDKRPIIGSPRQQIRTVNVAGSVRTQACLAVESPSESLGDTLIYVYPEGTNELGYVPALRPYRSGGGTVYASAGLVSGAYEILNLGSVTFQVPVSQLPRGLHLLMVRVQTATAATLTWTASTTLGGVDLSTVSGTYVLPNTGGSNFANVAVGRLSVPTRDVDAASDAVLTLTLSGDCTLDEAWLFASDGQLVMVSCGSATPSKGGSANRVFVSPATPAMPRPTLRIGHAADGSDAYHADDAFWQLPTFAPPSATVFISTSNAVAAGVRLHYFPRWHTQAAS